MSSDGFYEPGNYVERIRQIMPAPGWSALRCLISSDDTATFTELPVVGWGVVGYEVMEPELDAVHPRRDDWVKLLVSEGSGFAFPCDDDPEPERYQIAIFAPGVTPTEQDRTKLATAVRRVRDMRATREKKAVSVATGSSK